MKQEFAGRREMKLVWEALGLLGEPPEGVRGALVRPNVRTGSDSHGGCRLAAASPWSVCRLGSRQDRETSGALAGHRG